MREPHLHRALFIILLLSGWAIVYPVYAQDGNWVPAGVDYFSNLEALGGHSNWTFNTTRGPNERWGINFTISGFGFSPTTLIICDESMYHQMIQTGSMDQCHFVSSINHSLHTTVDLPHKSQWYLLINNTGPVTLYFTIRLTYYYWAMDPSTPSSPLESISRLFIFFVIILLLILIVIPCFCRFSCLGFFRRRTKKHSQNKEVQIQTTIVIMTQEQIEQYNNDED